MIVLSLFKKIGVIKTNTNDELREKLIKLALLQHHKLYRHNEYGPDAFDCSGLVWFIYNELFSINLYELGIGLSATTKIMTSKYGSLALFKENEKKDLTIIRKADILFFHRQSLEENRPSENNRYPGHCGIYLGEHNFIHASRTKGSVIISNFDKNDYWMRVLVASKNILSDNEVLGRMRK